MRQLLITSLLVLLPGVAAAQDSVIVVPFHRQGGARQSSGPDVRGLPRDVAQEVIQFVNAPTTLRLSGETRIPPARGIDGDVAVVGGPVSVAGRISGALMVVNGDLVLESGAVIDGDVLVVGGAIRGANAARVGGETRSYRDPLRYRRDADTLAYAPRLEMPWRRTRSDVGGSTSGIVLSLGGTYNRVEGVPVVFGPSADLRLNESMRFRADARAILRTAENFSLETGRMGYRVGGELVVGSRASNIGLGARAYDVTSSVESWPMKDFEAGWAAFLLHHDYRDWYRRRGFGLYGALRPSRTLSLTVEGRQEDHFSLTTNDPFSLFDNNAVWRENPTITDGRFRTLAASLRWDTRNESSAPSSGVFVQGELQATEGSDITGIVDPFLVCITTPCVPASLADGKLTFQRILVDARTYLRLTGNARLNLRLAGGGKLGGDDLPLQYRMSLGYPDPLPGYRFRQFSCGGDLLPGTPALCDRALVAQAEYRMHLGFDFGPDWANDWGDDSGERWEPFHVSGPDVVLFADAGRAWSVGSGPGQIPADRLPALSSFRTDLGVGLDFGPVGFYLAKSVGPVSVPLTFSVRLGRRF